MERCEPGDWRPIFHEYARAPQRFWGRQRAQAAKLKQSIQRSAERRDCQVSEIIDDIVSVTESRIVSRPLTVFLVNCGSSGSHWLEPMLEAFGDFGGAGEVYVPKQIRDVLADLSPTGRTAFLDALHIAHVNQNPTSLHDKILINSAHTWGLPRIFHDRSRTVLLTRDPKAIIISRTFRKQKHREMTSPSNSDAEYLKVNMDIVHGFFDEAATGQWDYHISYEALAERRHEPLIEVRTFLGLTTDQGLARSIYAAHASGGDAVQRTNLYEGEREREPQWVTDRISATASAAAQGFGYPG